MGNVRVLGIDVGARRIGLAISDVSGTLARPLTTLVVSDTNEVIVRIVATIQQLSAEADGLDAVHVHYGWRPALPSTWVQQHWVPAARKK